MLKMQIEDLNGYVWGIVSLPAVPRRGDWIHLSNDFDCIQVKEAYWYCDEEKSEAKKISIKVERESLEGYPG